MEHVAAAAGVSKALVYQHFASKEELFAAVTERVVEGFMRRLPTVLGTAGDALDAWRGVVRLLCDLVTERPESWALVARHLDNPELGAPLRRLREQVNEVLAVVLAGYFAPEQGVAVPSEEEVLTQARLTVPLLVGALQGLMSWWLEHPEVPRVMVEARAVNFGTSTKHSYDPAVEIDWEAPLDPDRYFLAPHRSSLYGTDLAAVAPAGLARPGVQPPRPRPGGLLSTTRLIDPKVYAAAGLDVGEAVAAAAANPHWRQTKQFAARKVIEFFNQVGLIAGPGKLLWRWAGVL